MGFFESFYVIPAAAVAFLLLGLWKVRKENGWFQSAFWISVAFGIWMIPVISASNGSEKEAFFQSVQAVQYLLYGLDVVLLFCLLMGIKQEEPESDVRFLWASVILTGLLAALLVFGNETVFILPVSVGILLCQYLAYKKL